MRPEAAVPGKSARFGRFCRGACASCVGHHDRSAMTTESPSWSSSLSKPIAALYKLGGLLLVFVFLGALMLLAGNFVTGTHATGIMTAGAALTFGCLFLYALPQLQATRATRKMREFCEQIDGNWWECVTPVDGTALSWIVIKAHPVENMVMLRGEGFDQNGVRFSTWSSVASCVNATENKVFYHWEGYQVAEPEKRYHGFGQIAFLGHGAKVDSGEGFFFDARLHDRVFTTKSFRLRRSTDASDETTLRAEPKGAAALIRKKIEQI